MVDFLDSRVEKFPKYLTAVLNHLNGIKSANSLLAGGRIEVDGFQDRVTSLDSSRRAAHNVAVNAMKQINRLCDRYEHAHVCPDTEDRYACANFAAAVTMECFMTDHKHSKDEIEHMYHLVGVDNTEANVDKVVEEVENGNKIVPQRKIHEDER